MRYRNLLDDLAVLAVVLIAIALTLYLFWPTPPPQQFPDSVTVPHRSCFANRCVQALPGGLVRETTRGGDVIAVWWR